MKKILIALFILCLPSFVYAGTQVPANDVTVNWTAFSGNLNSSDTTVQNSLQTLDAVLGSHSVVNWGSINGNINNQNWQSVSPFLTAGAMQWGTVNNQQISGSGINWASFQGFIQNTNINWNSLNQNINSPGVNWPSFVASIQSSNVNWTSLNQAIQASGINWTSLKQSIQGSGINWSSVVQLIQSGAVNWTSLNQAVQASGINWYSLTQSIQSPGVNWSSFVQAIQSGNVNWTSLNQAIQSPGINWTSFIQAIQSGAINWTSLNQVIQNYAVNWPSLNQNINSPGINWISFNQSIQSSNVNWTSLNQVIQSNGVNWTSLNQVIQSNGVNWTSLNQSIQALGINWMSLTGSQIQSSGINWISLNQVIQSNGVNWTSLNAVIQSSGINWNSLIQVIQSGAINWISLNQVIQSSGVNWTSLNKSIQSSGVNWTSLIQVIQASGINWASLTQNVTSSGINWTTLSLNGVVLGQNTSTPSSVALTGSANQFLNGTGVFSTPSGLGGASNWSQLIGDITLGNWQSTKAFLTSGNINWNQINALSPVNSGGINWANINILSPINMGGINWTNAASVNQSVNWGQGSQIAGSFQTQGGGAGWLQLYNAARTYYFGFLPNIGMSSSVNWTWPAADGSTGQALTTGGNGYLNWTTITGGGTGASNWSQLQGDITLANWTSKAPFLNRGTINWTDLQNGQSVNWGSGVMIAKQFNAQNPGTQSYLLLNDLRGINWLSIFAQSNITGNINWTLPNNIPTIGQVLTWEGTSNGYLNWTTITSGGGTGASNWSQLQGDITLANWTSKAPFLNRGTINWTDLQNGQSVNWGNVGQIAGSFSAYGNNKPNLQMFDSSGINWIGLQAPTTIGASINWTLPSVDGNIGQYLKTNGNKILGWNNSEQSISYQPGLLSAVNSTVGVYGKFVNASTVDNIIGSAVTFSCVSNPTVTMYECSTSTTCTSPTTIGTVTVTGSGVAVPGSISSAVITAGDYVGFATTSGTCASIDISVTAQVHSN